jgi:curved DNA-binding protein CbpA
MGFEDSKKAAFEQPSLRSKFLQLTKICHPDKPGGDNGTMKSVLEAYQKARQGETADLEALYEKIIGGMTDSARSTASNRSNSEDEAGVNEVLNESDDKIYESYSDWEKEFFSNLEKKRWASSAGGQRESAEARRAEREVAYSVGDGRAVLVDPMIRNIGRLVVGMKLKIRFLRKSKVSKDFKDASSIECVGFSKDGEIVVALEDRVSGKKYMAVKALWLAENLSY